MSRQTDLLADCAELRQAITAVLTERDALHAEVTQLHREFSGGDQCKQSLLATLHNVQHQAYTQGCTIDALRAALQAAAAALAPVAAFWPIFAEDPDLYPEHHRLYTNWQHTITVRDVRRAEAALAGLRAVAGAPEGGTDG